MKENKTIKAIAKLSSQEIGWFKEWVKSDYFNKHEKLRVLMEIIADAYPDFDENDFNKQKIFKKLFPREKYRPQKLSDLLTYLYRLYEKFLAQLSREEDELQIGLDLLRSYRNRNNDRQFLKTLELSKNANSNGIQTERSLLRDYFIEH